MPSGGSVQGHHPPTGGRHHPPGTDLALEIAAVLPHSPARRHLFSISDDNPRTNLPIATFLLIGMNVFVRAVVQGFGSPRALAESMCMYALIPGELLGHAGPGTRIQVSPELVCQFDGSANVSSLVTSMFMHGGWFHIIGNMWFLWGSLPLLALMTAALGWLAVLRRREMVARPSS